MNTNPKVQADPVTLNGLEAFLDQAHVEIVNPVPEEVFSQHAAGVPSLEAGLEKTGTYYETRTLLELLGQVQKVHDLLAETNLRLTRAYARLKHMERVVEEQEKRLELIPALESQAMRAAELQHKYEGAIAELEKMRQPWWNRLSSHGGP